MHVHKSKDCTCTKVKQKTGVSQAPPVKWLTFDEIKTLIHSYIQTDIWDLLWSEMADNEERLKISLHTGKTER